MSSYSSVSKPKNNLVGSSISPTKKPLKYSLDLSEAKSKPGYGKLQSSLGIAPKEASTQKISKPHTGKSSYRTKSVQPSIRNSPPKKYVSAVATPAPGVSDSVKDNSPVLPFKYSSAVLENYSQVKYEVVPNDFISFSDEFLQTVEVNDLSQVTFSKADFVKVIWDLNFINGLKKYTTFEQTPGLPLITLLWMILTKINKT